MKSELHQGSIKQTPRHSVLIKLEALISECTIVRSVYRYYVTCYLLFAFIHYRTLLSWRQLQMILIQMCYHNWKIYK